MKIFMGIHNLAYPPLSGVRKRTFHLLEETVKNHEVTVVAFGSPSDESGIRKYFGDKIKQIVYVDSSAPRWVNLLKRINMGVQRKSLLQISVTRKMQNVFDKVFEENNFDLIFFSSPVLLYYNRPASIPCITDTHNVEYDLFYRSYQHAKGILSKAYYYDQYRMMKQDEIKLCEQPEILLTTSERDKMLFKKDLPDQDIRVIPNGVDLDFFIPKEDIEKIPHSMVFTGIMNYLPNNDGILYFLDNIYPLILQKVPDAKIYIVGDKPSKTLMARANDNIIVTGRVKDVRPYIDRAQVYVIPLLIGGGTRLKALEASAMKKAIVSTSVGCEGINLRHEESALFADDPEVFCNAVLRLFEDREYSSRLAENAYSVIKEEYNWHAIGNQLNMVYESVEVAA